MNPQSRPRGQNPEIRPPRYSPATMGKFRQLCERAGVSVEIVLKPDPHPWSTHRERAAAVYRELLGLVRLNEYLTYSELGYTVTRWDEGMKRCVPCPRMLAQAKRVELSAQMGRDIAEREELEIQQSSAPCIMDAVMARIRERGARRTKAETIYAMLEAESCWISVRHGNVVVLPHCPDYLAATVAELEAELLAIQDEREWHGPGN